LRGETALGSGVDDEKHLAFELREVEFLSLVVQGFVVVNLVHIFCFYIVHDANIQTLFYIAHDILKKSS
jgi:hypothetical protein